MTTNGNFVVGYSIAVNVFKDFYKKKKKHVSQQSYSLEDIASVSGIEDDYEAKELFNEVVALINKLKYDQRAALILKHIKGFSYNEIAKILGTSSDNVRMKVCRAKQSICNEILNKRGGKK